VGVDACKPETLATSFEGVDVAVIVTPLDYSRGMSDDAQLTINMVNAAYEAGVSHVVYVGSWTVNAPDGVPMLATRFAPTEARLVELSKAGDDKAARKMGYTFLRSGYFM